MDTSTLGMVLGVGAVALFFFIKDMKKVKAKKARQDQAKPADQQAPSSQTADKD